jgi:hypothetical protein
MKNKYRDGAVHDRKSYLESELFQAPAKRTRTVHRKCSIHARRIHLQDRRGTGAREDVDDCFRERSGISSLFLNRSDDSEGGIGYRFRTVDSCIRKLSKLRMVGSRLTPSSIPQKLIFDMWQHFFTHPSQNVTRKRSEEREPRTCRRSPNDYVLGRQNDARARREFSILHFLYIVHRP